MIGTTLLDRYEIRSLLGEGGMSSVYLGFDKAESKEVALKFLLQKRASTKERQARLVREFSLLAKLSHPGVVKVYELHETPEGSPFFSMEVIPGKSLDKQIAEIYSSDSVDEKFTTLQFLRILEELADALHHIHSNGIIYCDLKPSNIVLFDPSQRGQLENMHVKLIDFGISRFEVGQDEQAGEGGTSLYNSPEQIRGESLDLRSDIYSYGITAFELTTGGLPFTGETQFRVTQSHFLQKVPSAILKNKAVSPTLDRMIRICMKKQKEDRYASMEEIIKRVQIERNSSDKTSLIKKFTAPFLAFLSK